MAFTLKNVDKAPRKLRKLLNDFPANPTPEEVHELRTQARRLEAVVDAVAPNTGKQAKHILKVVAPVQKAAGAVRDMDVLIKNVLGLSGNDGNGALVRLVERLAEMREKYTRRLHNVVAKRRDDADRPLKRYAKRLEKREEMNRAGVTEGGVAPQILNTELDYWPKLDEENLHPFRLRVKKLRDMLQLSDHAVGSRINALGDVKDVIGEWHDWRELLRIAEKELDGKRDRAVLQQIESIAKKKLRLALSAANSLRKRELDHFVSDTMTDSRRARNSH